MGAFYLPRHGKQIKYYIQGDDGEIVWKRQYFEWKELRDELVKNMIYELEMNELELPSTVYLITFIHPEDNNQSKVFGYLFYRKEDGMTYVEKLNYSALQG